MRTLATAVCLVWIAFVETPLSSSAQPTPPSTSICEMPQYRGTDAYNRYCVAHAPPPRSQTQQTPTAPRPSASQPPGPNLVLENGKWIPEDGYRYVNQDDNDFRVKWVPGKRSKEHPTVVASERAGVWRLEDGYKWLNHDPDDYRVVWVPGRHPEGNSNVVASGTPGEWRPEDGYIWRSEIQANTDYRVVEDHKVADALRAASIVVRWPEQLDHIEEFWGFKEYNYDRVTAALKILASGWIVDMPLAADRRQREVLMDHATKELKDALDAALSTIVNEMLDDMKKLTPYKWNPFGAEQRDLIARMKADTYALQIRGRNEVDSEASFTKIRSGSRRSALQYNSGQALGQLLEINRRRRWAD